MLICTRCQAQFQSPQAATVPQSFRCPKCGGTLVPLESVPAQGKPVPAPIQQPSSGGGSKGAVITLVILGFLFVGMVAFAMAGAIGIVVLANRVPTSASESKMATAMEDWDSEFGEYEIEMPDLEKMGIETAESSSKPRAPELDVPSYDAEMVTHVDLKSWNVSSVAFFPDASKLAVGFLDSKIAVYEIPSGRLLQEIKEADVSGKITQLKFTPSGDKVVALGEQFGGQIWQVSESGELEDPIDFSEEIQRPAGLWTHSNNETIIILSNDGTLTCWDATNGELQWKNSAFDDKLVTGELLESSEIFRVTDLNNVYDLQLSDGGLSETFALPRNARASQAAFSADGQKLYVLESSKLQVFDVEQEELHAEGPQEELLWTVAACPESGLVLAGGQARIHVFDGDSAEFLGVIPMEEEFYYVQTLGISSDGRFVATSPASAQADLYVFGLPKQD